MNSLRPYLAIARPDHWIKNVFVLPGIFLAYFFRPSLWNAASPWRLLAGLAAVCLLSSSNYVLNEILDARYDRLHPTKKQRPVPSGQVRLPWAYAEWLALGLAGGALAFAIRRPFGVCGLLLWVMGTLYNVPPVRLKDLPYADVLCESINNPIRLALGWYAAGFDAPPPLSMIMAYWMFGAFLMATKRFAEFREIGDRRTAAAYRKSFAYYDDERLLVSILFYVALFAMFSGVFIARYHFEALLAAPLVAYAIAYYLHLGFKPHSSVQYPEGLYKEHKLMGLVAAAFVAWVLLLFVELPAFDRWFAPLFFREP